MNEKKLTNRQLKVIRDLFETSYDVELVLQKNNIRPATLDKWMASEDFLQHFDKLIRAGHVESRVIIAKYSTVAAAKLLSLIDSKNPETSRKACIDLINAHNRIVSEIPNEPETNETETGSEADNKILEKLSPETIGRVLQTLSEN